MFIRAFQIAQLLLRFGNGAIGRVFIGTTVQAGVI